MSIDGDGLAPDWRHRGVGALMTTRHGGASRGRYATMNVGSAVGDDDGDVAANRAILAAAMNAQPVFLRQVHGARAIRVGAADVGPGAPVHDADAAVTSEPGIACVVQAADCLPILLAAPGGRAVGAAHAGWRGLAAGVVAAAVDAVCAAGSCAPAEIVAWLGPCIGPAAFEVGADVLLACGVSPGDRVASAHARFRPGAKADKWLADLPGLARDRLAAAGVTQVSGGAWCTVADPSRFFSFRRDGVTGRMAAAVWIDRR